MSEHPPERRRMPGKFITMDAAMLAAQNEKLDSLDKSIQELAKAVASRPTQWDLKKARKRARNQLIATILVFAVVMAAVWHNIQRLDRQCEDRNANTEKFRAVIAVIVAESGDNPDSPVAKALAGYLDTLKPIDC